MDDQLATRYQGRLQNGSGDCLGQMAVRCDHRLRGCPPTFGEQIDERRWKPLAPAPWLVEHRSELVAERDRGSS